MRSIRALGTAGVVVALTGLMAATPSSANENKTDYVQHNLVSDIPGMAAITDASLVNPWGLSQGPSTPAWVSDNGANVTTLYRGDNVVAPPQKVPLTVAIPGEGPTGQVFNSTGAGFVVSDGNGHSGSSVFMFASESGDITGWNPAVPPPPLSTKAFTGAHVDGAIYKGLALATVGTTPYLYAANFHARTVDVFDSSFTLVHLAGTFADPHLPKHYAPFNIALVNGKLYVAYARQDATASDDAPGHGRGIVDVFDTSGNLVKRLISHGQLNAPWGMTLAPADFGQFSGALLVGNFGDGRIHAYNPTTGRFLGTVTGARHRPLVIPGLWALVVGNGTSASSNSVLFTAGINDEADGLYGTITAGH